MHYRETIVGVDPSFTRTGFCELQFCPDTDKPVIHFYSRSFTTTDSRFLKETDAFFKWVPKHYPAFIILEEPLPQSYVAGYAWGLYVSLLHGFHSLCLEQQCKFAVYPTVETRIFALNPTTVRSFMNIKKKGKRPVTDAGNHIISQLGWDVQVHISPEERKRSSGNHDEMTGLFLILYYLLAFGTRPLIDMNYTSPSIHSGSIDRDLARIKPFLNMKGDLISKFRVPYQDPIVDNPFLWTF